VAAADGAAAVDVAACNRCSFERDLLLRS